MKVVALLSLVAVVTLVTVAQQIPEGISQERKKPATVEGKVVHAATGEPLRKAQIQLRPANSGPMPGPGSIYSATTDGEGKFRLVDVEPGKYRLRAERNGFVGGEYGARGMRQQGTILAVEAGQELKELGLKLQPHAVITGRVLDEDREAVAHCMVQVMRYGYNRGQKELLPMGATTTNDLGEYRIFGLGPGRYYLSATPRAPYMMGMAALQAAGGPGGESDYAPTYYPGTGDPGTAVLFEVPAGGQLRNMDVNLIKVRTVRVRGRVLRGGMPARRANVALLPRNWSGVYGFGQKMVMVQRPDGKFELAGVTPGSYTVQAYYVEDQGQLFGQAPIEVGPSNVEGVEVTLVPGIEVAGQVRVNGEGATSFGDISVYLSAKEAVFRGGGYVERLKEDGGFRLRGLGPFVYYVNVTNTPENAYLEAARMGEQDALENGVDLSNGTGGVLEITLNTQGAQLEGVVRNAKDEVVSGATVVLIPNERKASNDYLYKSTTTDQYGKYTIKGVKPGEYKVFAWEEIEFNAYKDPEVLKAVENRGVEVKAGKGEQKTVDVKLIPGGEQG